MSRRMIDDLGSSKGPPQQYRVPDIPLIPLHLQSPDGSPITMNQDADSPASIKEGTTTINFTISFEEALKFNLAVDECVRKLNSYNRAKTRGKQAALALVIHLDKGRIRVSEGKLNSDEKHT